MNFYRVQRSLLCIALTMFSLSFGMNEQMVVAKEQHVIWKSPVSQNRDGSLALAKLIKCDETLALKLKLIDPELEKRSDSINLVDFVVMKKEGPGFVTQNDGWVRVILGEQKQGSVATKIVADNIGAPYVHVYGQCFNSTEEASRKERKKIKQVILEKTPLARVIVEYACTYELKEPFDIMHPLTQGEMEVFYNFPVLFKAFLHSTKKRYETWFGEGSRCYYGLDGVTLPADYKRVKKNPNTVVSKYVSYDALPEEVKQLIDGHYENQNK